MTSCALTFERRSLLRRAVRHLWIPVAGQGIAPSDRRVLRLLFVRLGFDALWNGHRNRVLRELERAARRPVPFHPETLPTQFPELDALRGGERLLLRAWLHGDPVPPAAEVPASDRDALVIDGFLARLCRFAGRKERKDSGAASVRAASPAVVEAPPVPLPEADFGRIRFTETAFPAVPFPGGDPEVASDAIRELPDAADGRGLFRGRGFGTPVWFADAITVPNLWFIGDVHGQRDVLDAVLAYIDVRDPERADGVVFLGDLIDRGPSSAACLLRVCALARERRTAFLCGNHEAALYRHAGRYASSVTPHEFSRWLEGEASAPAREAFGGACLRLAARAPRALFLPNGVWAAHGGFPFRDVWGGLDGPEALRGGLCGQDFVWGRFRPDVRRRLVNRFSPSGEYGSEDLADWFAFLSGRLGVAAHTFIRGHDHIPEGAELRRIQDRWAVITCTTMSPAAGCVRVSASGDIEIVRGGIG